MDTISNMDIALRTNRFPALCMAFSPGLPMAMTGPHNDPLVMMDCLILSGR
jgi:hypothetical protein